MTTKIRNAASVAEARILELTKQFGEQVTNTITVAHTTTTRDDMADLQVKTIHVPHLGGIEVGYAMPRRFDTAKPTLVMIHSFTTDAQLYRSQYEDEALRDRCNLVAVDLLGHGKTRTKTEVAAGEQRRGSCAGMHGHGLSSTHWTYWDSAIMILETLLALGIEGKVFVLGTSQGGWVAVRMALLAPEKIAGILPLGTSMDCESERTKRLGCWDGSQLLSHFIEQWTTRDRTPDFTLGDEFCAALIGQGFGKDCSPETKEFWSKHTKANYQGDEGRRRLRMAAINLRDRDGLHGRLSDVGCPVLWLHGTSDVVYSVANAEEEIKLFINSADAKLRIIEGGQHFLSFSHPREVNAAVVDFLDEHAGMADLSRVDEETKRV